MRRKDELSPTVASSYTEPRTDELVEVGQWYWVPEKPDPEEPEEDGPAEWFGCVTHVGSNFAKLSHPNGHSQRVHLDRFLVRREHNPKGVIEDHVADCRKEITDLLGQVQAICGRLGLNPQRAIEHGGQEAYALARISGDNRDIDDYKAELVKAQKETLPALFKEIEEANADLVMWMKAETLPLTGLVRQMKGRIELIEGRIFNVSLYAGLTEDVALVRKGSPAPAQEKLHLMQRRLYMDEECLLNYRHGGMEFKDIHAFDQWLARSDNLQRVLPFQRCMVAMRVRRDEKRRSWGTLHELLIKIDLAELDELTFLYIRNGDQLYRLNCELEFGELIFPSRNEVDFSEPLMAKISGERVEDFMSVREYETRTAERASREAKSKAWQKKNPFRKWKQARKAQGEHVWEYHYERANPFHAPNDEIEPRYWKPFTPECVFYDECMKEIRDRINHYNRIALIIQGLYDRSEVLHPHPPVKTWTPDGFASAIELVYDDSFSLHDGVAPDFEAYSAKLNALIDKDSVLIGQERAWLEHEAERENNRRRLNWHYKREDAYLETFSPFGNDGPGHLAKPSRWNKKKREATFTWLRSRLTRRESWRSKGEQIKAHITVAAGRLFNVSAYKPGDYLQFFRDPRARADYLKWAPLLLTAEEYHAGNRKPQEPAE